jgi:hypothetical protein
MVVIYSIIILIIVIFTINSNPNLAMLFQWGKLTGIQIDRSLAEPLVRESSMIKLANNPQIFTMTSHCLDALNPRGTRGARIASH